MTTADQDRIASSHVLIAGVGGVGGRAAEVLARLGVGRLTVVDPDVFTTSNLNRQAGCSADTLGRSKSDVVAALCRSVNTAAEVTSVSEGITAENVADLVGSADVVIDGTDFTKPHLAVMLARHARARRVPMLMSVEVAFGAWYTTFAPGGVSLETFLGLPADIDTDELESGRVRVSLWRWVVRVPSYVELDVLRQVESGALEAPAIGPAVEVASAQLSVASLSLLTGRRTVEAPKVWHVDAREHRAGVFRPSLTRFRVSAARAGLVGCRNSRLG